ncbi:MAG: 50S ribosomal protein L11 methyltransferase [Thermodesulfobacteriota bacterium]
MRTGGGCVAQPCSVAAGSREADRSIPADGMAACSSDILAMVQSVSHRPTPHEIECCLRKRYPRVLIRNTLRQLIREGDLAYASLHGRQVLEPSIHRRIQISPHIALAPEGHGADSGGITVRLQHGAAFGTGQHPSTRLALRLMDHVFHVKGNDRHLRFNRVLDVGTGSGVLAIAALLLGAASATATDIDPCARFESRRNAQINGVAARIIVADTSLEDMDPFFDLVLANLRPPTLYAILPELVRLCHPKGFLVCAGMRSEELPEMINHYASGGFELWITCHEDDWGAAAFRIRS